MGQQVSSSGLFAWLVLLIIHKTLLKMSHKPKSLKVKDYQPVTQCPVFMGILSDIISLSDVFILLILV